MEYLALNVLKAQASHESVSILQERLGLRGTATSAKDGELHFG